MLYLSLHQNHIKLLYVKKTLLSQYESAFHEKEYAVDFLDENGNVINTDLLASAIKEALSSIAPGGLKDKDTFLILSQKSFEMLRTEVPSDIAPSAISSFVNDKARSNLPKDADHYSFDYLIQDDEKQKQIVLFALNKETLKPYQEALSLVDLKLINTIPESLAYFKLFEKTLRKDKKENLIYVLYQKKQVIGHLYDSYGPLTDEWKEEVGEKNSIEEILKKRVANYETQGKKINRLILAGENSENIRQDTFTKNVGVWTNPLKRIIPHFYQDYLKIFIVPTDKIFPFLQYDVCMGAFIFSLENRNFSLLKKGFLGLTSPNLPKAKFNLPTKELFIFIISFMLSFLTFLIVSKFNLKKSRPQISFFSKPTPTPTSKPTATPTPTIMVNKAEIKIKILNGSGVKGKASEVKEILQQAGYEEILTGNAENFDYETTEIQVKKGKESLANTLKKDLKEYVSSPKISTLDEEEAADIVLIFAKDFK